MVSFSNLIGTRIIDLDAPANQMLISTVLGKTRQAVSKQVDKMKLPADITNGDLLRGLFERYTEIAAGRGGDAQHELTFARIRETNASAKLKLIQVKEKAKELVPVDAIEPMLVSMVTAARQELLALPDKITSELKALYGVDVDSSIIEEKIHEALEHLATGSYLVGGSSEPEAG